MVSASFCEIYFILLVLLYTIKSTEDFENTGPIYWKDVPAVWQKFSLIFTEV